MFAAAAQIPTSAGSRYLQQLCKHWAHHLSVEYTPRRGKVVFPRDIRGADYPGDGIATFAAEPNYLGVTIEATSLEQLEGLQGVISSHLDRFAFREAPLSFQWLPASQPSINHAEYLRRSDRTKLGLSSEEIDTFPHRSRAADGCGNIGQRIAPRPVSMETTGRGWR